MWVHCSTVLRAQGLLMTAFIKLYLLDPQNADLRHKVVDLFEKYQKFMDVELQQRAVEYLVRAPRLLNYSTAFLFC